MIEEYNELNKNLEILGLNKIKEELSKNLDKNIFDNSQLIPFLNYMFKQEIEFRDKRAKEININISNFPYKKRIEDFDFSFQPGLSKSKIMDLMTLRFIENQENIIFKDCQGQAKQCCLHALGQKQPAIEYQHTLFPVQNC